MADVQDNRALNLAGASIGFGVLLMMAGVGYVLAYVNIPKENAQLFSTYLGLLGIQFGLVIGFFFGSSLNNKKQSEALATAANNTQTLAQKIPDASNSRDDDKSVTLAAGESAKVTAKDKPK
jgi:hypothetical protein